MVPRFGIKVVVLGGLVGCVPAPVVTDFDPEAGIGRLRRYAWMDSSATDRRVADEYPFLDRRLRRAVDRVLEGKGYDRRERGEVDLLVTAFVVLPPQGARPRVRLSASACGPFLSVRIGPSYPFGLGTTRSWRRFPYFHRSPSGWGCGYRVGFGFTWIPFYQEPDDRLAGTLVVDLVDPRSGDLVWRARAPGALLDLTSPGDQEAVDAVVARALRDLPSVRR